MACFFKAGMHNIRNLLIWPAKPQIVFSLLVSMGVRRLFSRGGQNFPGGAKTYYLPKKHLKTYYFPLKKSKTYYFGRPGGVKGPLLPSPADAHACFFDKNSP